MDNCLLAFVRTVVTQSLERFHRGMADLENATKISEKNVPASKAYASVLLLHAATEM
jgi:hypothetical protein